MPPPYTQELSLALAAVHRAVQLTTRVLASVHTNALIKPDHSPVSLADFGGQALLVAAIHHAFPNDLIVGEESAEALRADPAMAAAVWDLVQIIALESRRGNGDELYVPGSLGEMLDLIDVGGLGNGMAKGRMWTMDPVDGTRTFLKGGQYAVSLVLLEDAEEKVAVTACPHVTLENGVISETEVDREGGGYAVSAVKGSGVQLRKMGPGGLGDPQAVKWKKDEHQLNELVFTESVTPEKSSSPARMQVAESLGVPWNPVDIYSTQLRYVALALGLCDVMLRVPLSVKYTSSIWDHAGGILMYEEAGGWVTDLAGKRIDFGKGRKLEANHGIVAAPAKIHAAVLGAVERVLGASTEYK